MCLHKDCKEEFWTKILLIEHLKTDHKSPIQPALKLNFASEADFISWKDTEEAKTFSYFPQNSGRKNGRLYLYCQHDGSDQAHRKKGEEARKTSRKVRIGQIKQGATCIAKMVVVVSEDGKREVEYFPTHSHPLSSHDYAHQPPSSATNAFIDNQVALGISPSKILRTLQSTTTHRDQREDGQPVSKDVIVTKRRIRQRASKRRSKLRLHLQDPQSTFMKVDQLQKEKYPPILLYKPRGEKIVVGPEGGFDGSCLPSDLFMLGIQTKSQRELMVSGSQRILLADDTHNVTQYENVKLLNVMVVDENNKGWPVGHFISNCMSGDVIKYFIQAIKLRCIDAGEELNINCVITDDDTALINGMEAGMGMPLKHILCQWHLDEAFKGQLREKAPKDLFDTLYTELKVLTSERNLSDFKHLCEAFRMKHSTDAPKLIEHLDKHYFNRPEKWAMCYRQNLRHGNINTTGHVESLHNVIKTEYFKRIPNKRMDDLTDTLLNIEQDNFVSRQRDSILGFSEPPHLRKQRHEKGMTFPDDSLVEVNTFIWTIKSSTNPNVLYFIEKLQDTCTKDHCYNKCTNSSCHGVCSHMFTCSCPDRAPLCKHVHKLQSYLERNKPHPAYENLREEEVTFSTAVENIETTSDVPEHAASENYNFSEANAYRRLEVNLATLSEYVVKRSLPRHVVSVCDAGVDEIVRKCNAMTIAESVPNLVSMPARNIAPSQRLATQLSQLLPFKRRIKKNRSKKTVLDFEKREAAKRDLMSVMEDTGNEEDDIDNDADNEISDHEFPKEHSTNNVDPSMVWYVTF